MLANLESVIKEQSRDLDIGFKVIIANAKIEYINKARDYKIKVDEAGRTYL